jgi:hypothetical protein
VARFAPGESLDRRRWRKWNEKRDEDKDKEQDEGEKTNGEAREIVSH